MKTICLIAALFLATGVAHAQTEEERQRGLTAHNTCQDVIGAKIETGASPSQRNALPDDDQSTRERELAYE